MAGKLPIRNRVRDMRERHGAMTQQQLGDAIGVTRQTVIAIEQNRYSPSLESAFRIARLFGAGVEDVFSWEMHSPTELAKWLLVALQNRWTNDRIREGLVSQFEFSQAEAIEVLEHALDGVMRAIGGKQDDRPDPEANPVARASFDILWSSFKRYEFFATGRAPTQEWLDWLRDHKAQQELAEHTP
ncbi:MAG: helix-turn-helix transcriptional regulator [Woeseiaceae bacterium]